MFAVIAAQLLGPAFCSGAGDAWASATGILLELLGLGVAIGYALRRAKRLDEALLRGRDIRRTIGTAFEFNDAVSLRVAGERTVEQRVHDLERQVEGLGKRVRDVLVTARREVADVREELQRLDAVSEERRAEQLREADQRERQSHRIAWIAGGLAASGALLQIVTVLTCL